METILPWQPGLRVPADGALPVWGRAARTGNRAHPRRRNPVGRQTRSPARYLAKNPQADAEGLRRLPAAGRPVRPVRVRRQPVGQSDPQRLVVHDYLLRPLPGWHTGIHRRRDSRRVTWDVVFPPDSRFGELDWRQALPLAVR